MLLTISTAYLCGHAAQRIRRTAEKELRPTGSTTAVSRAPLCGMISDIEFSLLRFGYFLKSGLEFVFFQ